MKHKQNTPISLISKGEMAAPTPGPSQLTDKGKGKETAMATGSTGNVPEQEDMVGVGDAGTNDSGGADVSIGHADGASGSGGERVPVSTMDLSVGAGVNVSIGHADGARGSGGDHQIAICEQIAN
jgi:hypothetical protein